MTESEIRSLLDAEKNRWKDKECVILAMAIGFKETYGKNDPENFPVIFQYVINAAGEPYIEGVEFFDSKRFEPRMCSMRSFPVRDGEYSEEMALHAVIESYQKDWDAVTLLMAGKDFSIENLEEPWNKLVTLREQVSNRRKYPTKLDKKFMKDMRIWIMLIEHELKDPKGINSTFTRPLLENLVKAYRKAEEEETRPC